MRIALYAIAGGLMLAGPVAAKDKTEDFDPAVWEIFAAAYAEACMFDSEFMPPPEERMQVFEMTYEPTWTEDIESESITVYQMNCFLGAYNEASVFFVRDAIEGLQPLSFSAPSLDIEYADDDIEAEVTRLEIAGFRASTTLINAVVDTGQGMITSYSRWRGLNDASSAATYRLVDGQFILVLYEVDATYDGELNSEVILQYP